MSMSRFRFDAIGTSWDINKPSTLGVEARKHILNRVEKFDAIYSRFCPDSLVTRIDEAKSGGTFAFPVHAVEMFDLYDRLHRATGGAVDPLIGRDLELIGYDRYCSLTASPTDIAE
jgi:thiamine biosynthesis lipoprotein